MNDHYSDIESRVEALKPDISLKDQKRLRLAMVLRVARRLDSLSLGCETCVGRGTSIDRLVDSIKGVGEWQIPEWKAYYNNLDDIIKHLKTAHHLVEEGEHMALWAILGIAAGVVLGFVFGEVVLGAGLGIVFGVAVGGMLDAIAHKQGRVI
jgi:hypothetical protein